MADNVQHVTDLQLMNHVNRWISLVVWCFFSNNVPRQYIAIHIVIRLSCIAIYRNTLLPYRDIPTGEHFQERWKEKVYLDFKDNKMLALQNILMAH